MSNNRDINVCDKIVMGVYNGEEIGVYRENDGYMGYSYSISRPATELTPPDGESAPLLLGIPGEDIQAIINSVENNNAVYDASEIIFNRGALNDSEQQILKNILNGVTQRTWEKIKSLAKFDKNVAKRRVAAAANYRLQETEKRLETAKAEVARLEALKSTLMNAEEKGADHAVSQ